MIEYFSTNWQPMECHSNTVPQISARYGLAGVCVDCMLLKSCKYRSQKLKHECRKIPDRVVTWSSKVCSQAPSGTAFTEYVWLNELISSHDLLFNRSCEQHNSQSIVITYLKMKALVHFSSGNGYHLQCWFYRAYFRKKCLSEATSKGLWLDKINFVSLLMCQVWLSVMYLPLYSLFHIKSEGRDIRSHSLA